MPIATQIFPLFQVIRELISDLRPEPSHFVSDINMPVMDGFAFLAEIRRNEKIKSIRVIVATSGSKVETCEKITKILYKTIFIKKSSWM